VSDKLKNLTPVTTLSDNSLFYAVDPTRDVNDTDVSIDKNSLASLLVSNPLFLGTYTSLANLTIAHPDPEDGSIANIDVGIGEDVIQALWDNDDDIWVLGAIVALQNLQTTTDGVGNNITTNPVIIQNELTVGDGNDALVIFDTGADANIEVDNNSITIQCAGGINLITDELTADDNDIVTISDLKYNAATNVPPLADTDMTLAGFEIIVGVAGTQDFGSGAITFGVNDVIGNDGIIYYKKVDNNQNGGVSTASQDYSPFTALPESNNEFVIIASAIARTSNTPSNGALITWDFLANDTNHGSSFFTSVEGETAGQGIIFKHPAVKNIMYNSASPDEAMVKKGAMFGARGEDAEVQYQVGRPVQIGCRLTGNGTNWSKAGTFADNITIDSFASGTIKLTRGSDTYDFDAELVTIEYHGTNNYRTRRVYSGLAGSDFSFQLVDNATNSAITTAPTSADKVQINHFGKVFKSIQMRTWSTTTAFTNNEWLDGFANVWATGIYELWFKVETLSDTSLRSKWQLKSGVTTYKLYIDTNEDFSTETLIYSGTNQQFESTGLTANTVYYFRLDDQTDTEISRFVTKTRPTALQNA
jgi:hypothetical protein